jgi:hypothetical protein
MREKKRSAALIGGIIPFPPAHHPQTTPTPRAYFCTPKRRSARSFVVSAGKSTLLLGTFTPRRFLIFPELSALHRTPTPSSFPTTSCFFFFFFFFLLPSEFWVLGGLCVWGGCLWECVCLWESVRVCVVDGFGAVGVHALSILPVPNQTRHVYTPFKQAIHTHTHTHAHNTHTHIYILYTSSRSQARQPQRTPRTSTTLPSSRRMGSPGCADA